MIIELWPAPTIIYSFKWGQESGKRLHCRAIKVLRRGANEPHLNTPCASDIFCALSESSQQAWIHHCYFCWLVGVGWGASLQGRNDRGRFPVVDSAGELIWGHSLSSFPELTLLPLRLSVVTLLLSGLLLWPTSDYLVPLSHGDSADSLLWEIFTGSWLD